MKPRVSQLPAPSCASYHARGVRFGIPEVRTGQVFGRAQRAHAREVQPGPRAIERILIEHQQVADSFAQQPEGRGQPALPAAHDDHVVDRFARRRRARLEPGAARVVEQLEIALARGERARRGRWAFRRSASGSRHLRLEARARTARPRARAGARPVDHGAAPPARPRC